MSASRRGYTITEIADACGLTVRSLRYYEQIGLVTPARSPGNARVYRGEVIERVRTIAALRTGGVELSAICAAFGEDDRNLRSSVSRIVVERLEALERQKADLINFL